MNKEKLYFWTASQNFALRWFLVDKNSKTYLECDPKIVSFPWKLSEKFLTEDSPSMLITINQGNLYLVITGVHSKPEKNFRRFAQTLIVESESENLSEWQIGLLSAFLLSNDSTDKMQQVFENIISGNHNKVQINIDSLFSLLDNFFDFYKKENLLNLDLIFENKFLENNSNNRKLLLKLLLETSNFSEYRENIIAVVTEGKYKQLLSCNAQWILSDPYTIQKIHNSNIRSEQTNGDNQEHTQPKEPYSVEFVVFCKKLCSKFCELCKKTYSKFCEHVDVHKLLEWIKNNRKVVVTFGLVVAIAIFIQLLPAKFKVFPY